MIHLTTERNYTYLETPVLQEVIGLVDAQIWSAEDTLRALNLTRDAMLVVLTGRTVSEGTPHAEG